MFCSEVTGPASPGPIEQFTHPVSAPELEDHSEPKPDGKFDVVHISGKHSKRSARGCIGFIEVMPAGGLNEIPAVKGRVSP